MSDAPQPTSGSLSAKIIRACPTHKTCPLTCKQRQVEDLGEIASFSMSQTEQHESIVERIKHTFRRS